MLHFEENGIISAEDRRAVYERALELLESDPADDGGITELACELIQDQLLQIEPDKHSEGSSSRNISGI